MKDEDKTFEAYFSGKMNSAEANDFSTALHNNKILEESYNLFLAAKQAGGTLERDRMRAELESMNLEEIKELKDRAKVLSPKLRILRWLGGIAALFMLAFFAYNSLQPPSSQELFASNFETYKVQAARGGDIDALKTVYTEGSYENFTEEALTKEETPELNMMIANAYINTDRFDEAIKTLTKISDDTSLRDQKYWYLGLSHLNLGNLTEANKNFKKLLSLSNYKKQETEEILSTISKL